MLLETSVNFDGANTVFARAEYVDKSAADLNIPVAPLGRFGIGSVVLGYVRDVWSGNGPLALGLGAAGIGNLIPRSLTPYYGTRTPGGFAIFLRLRVEGEKMTGAMAGMPGMN